MNRKELYQAIAERHSVRTYQKKPLSAEDRNIMEKLCVEGPSLIPGARVVLVADPPEYIFPGLMIKNAPAFLVMIGDSRTPHIEAAVGYLGEYAILAATSLGFGSCWVAGTFRPDKVAEAIRLAEGEHIFAVSPMGYPDQTRWIERSVKAFAKSGSRKPIESLLAPQSLPWVELPEWAQKAIGAARLAPSAVNRQPWRFAATPSAITVALDDEGKEASKRLDCGIAMLHLELGAEAAGKSGKWQMLEQPKVATFELKTE